MYHIYLLFISLFVALANICLATNVHLNPLIQPQVTLELGTLRGFYQKTVGGRNVASFQAVPYAKQPMGRHRFKNSIEMGPWLGVYDATGEASDCLQLPPTTGPVSGTEDCLYLNIYTPSVPTGTEVRPLLDVLVYIHGGSFMYYGSKQMSPKYLLDKDIVLVTLNYRLGPLGFLSTGDSTIPGNSGMKDQVMALRWVQRYISSFGGDPNKVTLAGHSAGSAAVHYHLLSPISRGLFQKAIMGSGSALNPWAKAENVKEKTMALAARLGCAFHDFNLLVKCLRSRPSYHITGFSEELMGWKNMPFAPFAPIVETVTPGVQNHPGTPQPFLTEEPLSVITSGQADDVPILFSFAPVEGSYPSAYFIFDDKFREELVTRWDELLPLVLDFSYTVDPNTFSNISQTIKQHYLQGIDLSDKISAVQSLIQMIGDRHFTSGIAEASRLHAEYYKSPVYAVRFSYKAAWSDMEWACNCTDNLVGALHYDDAGFLIDSNFPETTLPLDKQVQSNLLDLWFSFITSGKPLYDSVAVPDVKATLPALTYLDVGLDGKPSILSETDPGHITFWKSLNIADNLVPPLAEVHTEL